VSSTPSTSGCSPAGSAADIERGKRNCALRTIYALADALGVTPADLFK
jgi:hypothetical protein